MQSLIIFGLLFGCALAIPAPHYATVPVVHNKVVGYQHHTPLHTVQKVHHTVHPVHTPIHHPPVTTVHQEPTAVLAKAPKISGYAFKSEVRHDAPAKAYAAPAVYAAPAAYAPAPVAYGHAESGYGATVTHAGGYTQGGDLHGYAGDSHGSYGPHAPAYVSHSSLAVAPAKIVETPAVSSYKLETGRIDTHTQEHYAVAHKPVTKLVGYQTHQSTHAVHHAEPLYAKSHY